MAEAEELFKYIPTELIVDYLDLYRIKLTEKEYDLCNKERRMLSSSWLEIREKTWIKSIAFLRYSRTNKNTAMYTDIKIRY